MRSPTRMDALKAASSPDSTKPNAMPFDPTTRAAGPFAASHMAQPFSIAPTSWPGPDTMEQTRDAEAGEPRSARKLYELGLTYAALGEIAGSIDALRQATTLKPDFTDAWRKLADLLRQSGDVSGAQQAEAAYHRCTTKEGAIKRAAKLFSTGKLEAAQAKWHHEMRRTPAAAAELVLREHLRRNPTDASAILFLAEILMSQDRYPESEALLERALELAPAYAAARYNYAIALFRQHKAVLALPHVQRLLASDPRHVKYRILLAGCLAKIGDFAPSIVLYEGLLKTPAREPKLLLSYSNALKSVGRRDDSIQACRACLEMEPTSGEAYLNLANLDVGSLTASDFASMRSLLAKPGLPVADRIHLHYALGRALEPAGEFADSFAHFAEGARLKRAEISYDANDTASRVERAINLFSPAFFADRLISDRAEPSNPVPIFIVGLPRSGTTLIEQILASHSAIEGTIELPDIELIAHDLGDLPGRANRSTFPDSLADLDAGGLAALGERYIERTSIYRKTQRPYFIDKMPANWAYIGLIHLILPEARIIDARRHPIATCFGAFKRCFSYGQNFSYDLTELGRYYNDYVRMMAHFDTALPGLVHRVTYETMVDETEAEIRRLFAYLNLPVEPACLRFWDTERAVSTASSEQVRRPIFREGLDQWRHYEPWLTPLQAVLQAT